MAIVCYNCFCEKEGNGTCQYCGYDSEQDKGKYVHALPCGTVLAGKYITGRVLGQGGFGITYIAQEHGTGKLVAVKEYFPETMSSRGSSNMIVPYSGQTGEDFLYGKGTFLDEAKTLAQFSSSPNIIHVYSYFEENGTAYFAMEYAAGITLQQYIKNEGGKITYDQAERLLLPVMEALSVVHTKGLIHRDIKPDNIIVGSDGNVKLIDFGAARYSLGEKSQSLDVVLTHGFSPFEQYSRNKGQGPYTDVYAFAATFYYAITGVVPPDSIDRVGADRLIPPGKMINGLSEARESAILRGLAVQPEERFQTMTAFCMALLRNQPQPVPPSTFWEKLKKWMATHRGPMVGITVAVLALVSLLIYSISASDVSDNPVDLSETNNSREKEIPVNDSETDSDVVENDETEEIIEGTQTQMDDIPKETESGDEETEKIEWKQSCYDILMECRDSGICDMFSLYDLNDDGLPELIVSPGDAHAYAVQIFTFYDGSAHQVHDSLGSTEFGSWGVIQFSPAENVFCSGYFGQGMGVYDFMSLDGDTFVYIESLQSSMEMDGSTKYGSSTDPDISEEEFNALYQKYSDGEISLGRDYSVTTARATIENYEAPDNNSPLAAAGNVIDTTYYQIIIPESWQGQVVCQSVVGSDNVEYLDFYHVTSLNEGMGGFLFSIGLFDDVFNIENLPAFEVLGTISVPPSEIYTVVVMYPTDVQFSDSTANDYYSLQDDIPSVLDTFQVK